MRGEKKKIITQWLFPTIVLVAVICGLLINLTERSGVTAAAEVEADLIVLTEKYASELYNDFASMTNSALTAGYALSRLDKDVHADFLFELRSNSPAYMIVYSDLQGKGITETGDSVDLSGEGYFTLLKDKDNAYVCVEDDGITGSGAVVHAIETGDQEHTLYTYYPLKSIETGIREGALEDDFFYLLMDQSGKILAHNDYASPYLEGENLFETLGEDTYSEEFRRMDMRLKNEVSGSFRAEVEGEARTLVYTPFRLEEWTIVMGVNQSYVDNEERKQWEYTRSALFQLAMVILIFLIVVVLINLFNKMRNTENTKKLEEKADTDLLTGLNNKLATERKIKEFMETHPNEQSMMFVLDIDNFKKINDTMGHAFGDEVLRSLGSQITGMFRVTDIVGRVGGDEFIILLKNLKDDALLKKESEKVARFFHDFKTGEYVKYSATASIGVAVFPKDGKDFETIYKAADQALYSAKKRGKNQLAFYHDYLDPVVIDK